MHKIWVCGSNNNNFWLLNNLTCVLKTNWTCNLIVKFSKHEFKKKVIKWCNIS